MRTWYSGSKIVFEYYLEAIIRLIFLLKNIFLFVFHFMSSLIVCFLIFFFIIRRNLFQRFDLLLRRYKPSFTPKKYKFRTYIFISKITKHIINYHKTIKCLLQINKKIKNYEILL